MRTGLKTKMAFRVSSRRLGSILWNQFRRPYSSAEGMPLTFSSPTKAFYSDVLVKQVDLASTSGDFGILPDHVPSIALLKPGVVRVYEADGIKKFFVSSGSVTINNDSSVQILAEEASPLEELDLQAARQGLESSQQQLASASGEQAKAEAQISVDFYQALVAALES